MCVCVSGSPIARLPPRLRDGSLASMRERRRGAAGQIAQAPRNASDRKQQMRRSARGIRGHGVGSCSLYLQLLVTIEARQLLQQLAGRRDAPEDIRALHQVCTDR